MTIEDLSRDLNNFKPKNTMKNMPLWKIKMEAFKLHFSWLKTVKVGLLVVFWRTGLLGLRPAIALPHATSMSQLSNFSLSLSKVWTKLLTWVVVFALSGAMSASEMAVTTLYPWKVREIAEEEGNKSPFYIIDKDIARVLSTILVTSTAAGIYSAALFTSISAELFSSRGQVYATLGLTLITLFFGELLPKSLGVSNAEIVARFMLPPIILLVKFFGPFAELFTNSSKIMLKALGFEAYSNNKVSEEELRLIVTGAKQSGGIDSEEGKMIEGVLGLQDAKVSEVMCPRVDVVGIDRNEPMSALLQIVKELKYSRVPVYDGEIDRIEGVVLAKNILKYVENPDLLSQVKVKEEMEPTYFVPESMTVWNLFEEMRKRKVHLAVVVDEYGGTAGIVTLEDILEEVVGEIYDEEDIEEEAEEKNFINLLSDGTYRIDGLADLEDFKSALNLQVSEDDLRQYSTVSGFLCSQAGQIPVKDSHILLERYCFTITEADERRILTLIAKPLGQDMTKEGSSGRDTNKSNYTILNSEDDDEGDDLAELALSSTPQLLNEEAKFEM